MAPPINVQDWYGDRHTCQIASGALDSYTITFGPVILRTSAPSDQWPVTIMLAPVSDFSCCGFALRISYLKSRSCNTRQHNLFYDHKWEALRHTSDGSALRIGEYHDRKFPNESLVNSSTLARLEIEVGRGKFSNEIAYITTISNAACRMIIIGTSVRRMVC